MSNVRVWFRGNDNMSWINESDGEFKVEHSLELAFFRLEELERIISRARARGFDSIAIGAEEAISRALSEELASEWRRSEEQRIAAELDARADDARRLADGN